MLKSVQKLIVGLGRHHQPVRLLPAGHGGHLHGQRGPGGGQAGGLPHGRGLREQLRLQQDHLLHLHLPGAGHPTAGEVGSTMFLVASSQPTLIPLGAHHR